MADLTYLSDDNFEKQVTQGVTLVDFYADWCGPCRRLTPILEALHKDFQGKATIAKIDVDKAPQVTTRFGVTSIPTLVIFKNGKEVQRFIGVKDQETLAQALEQQL